MIILYPFVLKKRKKEIRLGNMVQVIELLSSKLKALNSNPTITKKTKEKKKKKEEKSISWRR
jgi:hypothetical protein